MRAWMKTSLAALLASAAAMTASPAAAQDREPTPQERVVLDRADLALKAKDYARLRAILSEPALAKLALAHRVLGQLHAQGLGGPQDTAAARAEYRRAAELGDFQTMLGLAEELEREGTPASRTEAKSWFTAAINSGSVLGDHARGHLGRMAWTDGDFTGAVNHWSRGGNDVFARSCLGAAYALGKGTTADPLMANYTFRQVAGRGPSEGMICAQWAAEAGNAHAQYALATIYGDSKSKAFDAAQSAAWYAKAADSGHPEAAYWLARMLDEGKSVPRDPAGAYRYYGLAANNPAAREYDRKEAFARMGEMAFAGDGVAKNVAEAVRLLEKGGYGDHNYQLGLIYAGAGGYPVNMAKAVEAMRRVSGDKDAQATAWLKQQAEAGNADAQYAYAAEIEYDEAPDKDQAGRALTYEQREAIEVKTRDLAWQYYRRAARQNQLEAMYKVAASDSALPDAERVRLMRAAADRGHVTAMLELAKWSFLGWYGLAKSEANERAWLDRAAATGDPYGAAGAGETYLMRGAVTSNYTAGDPAKVAEMQRYYRLAIAFYERAHAAGNEQAAGTLASIYERNPAGLANPQLALKWRKLDVERNAGQERMETLSTLYEKATPADPMRAWFWAKSAGRYGTAKNEQRLAALWQRMTAAQRTTAERATMTCELSNWQNCSI